MDAWLSSDGDEEDDTIFPTSWPEEVRRCAKAKKERVQYNTEVVEFHFACPAAFVTKVRLSPLLPEHAKSTLLVDVLEGIEDAVEALRSDCEKWDAKDRRLCTARANEVRDEMHTMFLRQQTIVSMLIDLVGEAVAEPAPKYPSRQVERRFKALLTVWHEWVANHVQMIHAYGDLYRYGAMSGDQPDDDVLDELRDVWAECAYMDYNDHCELTGPEAAVTDEGAYDEAGCSLRDLLVMMHETPQ
jgi:uncharacterized protein (UPF0147 family)